MSVRLPVRDSIEHRSHRDCPDLLHHLLQRLEPTLQRAEPGVLLPELLQFGFEIEAAEEAVIPLLGGEVAADGGEIDDGDGHSTWRRRAAVWTISEDLPI